MKSNEIILNFGEFFRARPQAIGRNSNLYVLITFIFLFAVDGRSVYVKNLPINISSSQLEEEFGKFGLIKPGGVNVKSQKQGACYAFVEFEEMVSAQTAIEMSPVSVGGRQVYIEEKRPMGPRAGGRGGRVLGSLRTDRPFRSDGLRSRGTFGGRGVGSRGGGQDRDRDVPNRGRGTGSARATSGTLGGHANFVNITGVSGVVDSSRRDAQGGNSNRIPRRGGINQAPRNGAVTRGSPSVTAV